MKKDDNSINGRTYLVGGIIFVFLIVIMVKLVYLQQIEGDKYRKKAEDMTLREAEIKATPGNLYSDDGSLLATSVIRYNLRWDSQSHPIIEKKMKDSLRPLGDSLSKMFGKTSSYYQTMLKKAFLLKNRNVFIADNLGYTEYMRIKKFPIFNGKHFRGGLKVDKIVKRRYPLGGIAHRSIGYERKDDSGNVTRVGLEGAYARYLMGTPGRRMEQRIAKGQYKPLSSFNEIEPEDGKDVVSTINTNIQDIAHHALLLQLKKYKAHHGCAVVMEVSTGEVKAISNLTLNEKKDDYIEDYNYAIGESHEPGSVFKLMTVVAAMETRGIDSTYMVDIKDRKISYYDATFEDSQHRFTGRISINKAFSVSSNVGMTEMVHQLYPKSPSDFIGKLLNMNLNQKLNLPIQGEGEPKFLTPRDKEWSGVTMESMSIGYSLQLTPMQSLAFYNAIANDGVMVKPRMIKEVRKWNETVEKFNVEIINPKICSKETAQMAKGMLADVVQRSYGSGHRLYSPDFSMAGKTGTARKDYNKVKDKSKMSYISSFAGFFPVENPKYSCIVVIHEPDKTVGIYGADVSGPVFKSIAHKIYTNSLLMDTVDNVDEISASTTDSYLSYYNKAAKFKTVMPNLMGMSAMDAIALLENMGAKVKISGQGKVKDQSLPPGSKIAKNMVILLQCGSPTKQLVPSAN